MARFLMADGTLYDTDKCTKIAEYKSETMYVSPRRHVFLVNTSGFAPGFEMIFPGELPTPEQTKQSEHQYIYLPMKRWLAQAGRADLLKEYFDIDVQEA